MAEDAVDGRVPEFSRQFLCALEGFVHDNAAIHDEENTAAEGSLGGRERCLRSEGEKGAVEARGLAAAGGDGDVIGRLAGAKATCKFYLPGERFEAPEGVKKFWESNGEAQSASSFSCF